MDEEIQSEKRLVKSDWFKGVIEEMRATIVEAVFTSRWVIIEAKWHLGDLILKNQERLLKAGVKKSKIPDLIAEELKKKTKQDSKKARIPSKREIYRCMRFRKEYPDLDELPGGKNISWHKIANRLLPGKELECQHKNLKKIEVWKCEGCSQTFINKPD